MMSPLLMKNVSPNYLWHFLQFFFSSPCLNFFFNNLQDKGLAVFLPLFQKSNQSNQGGKEAAFAAR